MTPLFQSLLLPALLAATLSALLTATLRKLAGDLGLVDRQGPLKPYGRPVPLTGGSAVFLGVCGPLLVLTLWPGLSPAWPGLGGPGFGAQPGEAFALASYLLGALVLHVTGLVDDRVVLGPIPKLLVQLAVGAGLAIGSGVRLLPEWIGAVPGTLLTILWLVTVVNAFNFLDGLDGLAGSVGALCAGMFLLTAVLTDQPFPAVLMALLLGALIGFLPFNWPPARVFLGDSGSLFVGWTLAFCSVRLTYYDLGARLETPWYAVFTPLLVLAIPLYDLTSVSLLRLFQGRNPMSGDLQHFAHRLSRRGLSPTSTLAVVCASTLATGLGGTLLLHLEAWQALLVVAQAGAVIAVLVLLERTGS